MEAEREERWKWSPEEGEEEKKKKRSEKGEERNLSRLPLLLPYSGRQADPSLLFLFPPSVSSVLFSLSCLSTYPPTSGGGGGGGGRRPSIFPPLPFLYVLYSTEDILPKLLTPFRRTRILTLTFWVGAIRKR